MGGERFNALLGTNRFANGEDALLGVVDERVDVLVHLLFAVLVGVMNVQRTSVDEFAQDVFIQDDLFVIREVRGDRDEGEQFRDRGGTAYLVEEVLFTQRVGQRDGIDRQIFVVKLQQFLVDGAVGVVVKGERGERDATLAQAFNRILEEAGENAFLGLVTEGQGTIEGGEQFLR